jgi:DNA-binding transcriptional LysR family regulator
VSDFEGKRFDELSAFLAIEREGSIAGAGRLLQKHPTVISKRLSGLEARLGSRLVERTTRQVHLTAAGRSLAERIRSAFDTIDEAELEASAATVDIKGHIRLAFPGTMGRQWLAPLIPQFLELHPHVTMEIDYSDRFVDLLGEGYDAALRVGILEDSSLVARKLCSHRRALVASPLYIEKHGLPQAPHQLTGHSCLMLSGIKSHPAWHFTRGSERQRVVVSGRLTSNDSESLLAAARSGLGILAAGEWLSAKDIATGALVPVLNDWEFNSDGAVHIVRPSVAYPPARVEAFVDWLRDMFSAGPPWATNPAR